MNRWLMFLIVIENAIKFEVETSINDGKISIITFVRKMQIYDWTDYNFCCDIYLLYIIQGMDIYVGTDEH